MSVKILLDTNAWRYLVDSGRQSSLYIEAKRSGVQIAICPAILGETLRIEDKILRNKLIELQTRRCWLRLMPDAYLECEDIRKELVKSHSEWVNPSPNNSSYRKLKSSWTKTNGGWWAKLREDVDATSAKILPRDAKILSVVRKQSYEMRSQVIESKKPMVGNWLPSLSGSLDLNGETVRFDGWRVYAFTIWANMLHGDATVREWMGWHINIDRMIYPDFEKFQNFWLYEVKAEAVPREWLRCAIFAMQSDRKVTDGNPVDATISVHLVDVDFVISADRNFVSMIKRCHAEAPFKTSDAFLIRGGNAGVDDLFQLIHDGVKTSTPH